MINFNKIALAFLFVLVSTLSFSAASNCNAYDDRNNDYGYNTYDNNDNVIFILKQQGAPVYTNSYWENEDRYPTYDYRNGYSYRTSQDYYDMRNSRDRVYRNSYDYDDDYFVYQSKPQVYYEYVDYMDTYEKRECYTYPPKDKVIYTRCPVN